MKKFVCNVCGYVHTAEELAADFRCPVCRVPASKFTEQKGEMKLAAVHEYGVYAQTVKNNPDISAEDKKYIFEQLMANFQGECSEVGMYLCMARIAHREGYPEIGLYWEKAAWEEAEHAAKFAELLGEDLEPNIRTPPRPTWHGALTASSAPPPARPTWPSAPRRTAWMPSTTPSTKWLVTRQDTARHCRAYWSVTSSNPGMHLEAVA